MGQNTTMVSVSRIPQRSPRDRIQQWGLFLVFNRGLYGTEYNNVVCFSYFSEVSMGQTTTMESVSCILQRSPWNRIQQWCLFLVFLRGLQGTEYNNGVCFSYSSEVSMEQYTTMVSVSHIKYIITFHKHLFYILVLWKWIFFPRKSHFILAYRDKYT